MQTIIKMLDDMIVNYEKKENKMPNVLFIDGHMYAALIDHLQQQEGKSIVNLSFYNSQHGQLKLVRNLTPMQTYVAYVAPDISEVIRNVVERFIENTGMQPNTLYLDNESYERFKKYAAKEMALFDTARKGVMNINEYEGMKIVHNKYLQEPEVDYIEQSSDQELQFAFTHIKLDSNFLERPLQIGGYTMQHMKIKEYQDVIKGTLYKLETEILTNNIKQSVKKAIDVPSNWWQHLKMQLGWKYKTKSIIVEVVLKRDYTWPYAPNIVKMGPVVIKDEVINVEINKK